MDLEKVWEMREEEIYPALFGSEQRGIFTLSSELFSSTFHQQEVDPRWLSMGVIEFAPTTERASWVYVTSGMSNPWFQEPSEYDPEGESGYGVEFTFSVAAQGDWAINTLANMLAYNLLLNAGVYPGCDHIGLHDRLPLNAPIDGNQSCEIKNLILTECEDIPRKFGLPSGEVILVGFTGITDSEVAYAKSHSSDALIDKLRDAGAHPVTDPRRRPVI
ncbi:suppressor of fused domain protein [Pseudoblastomonas halimionae]|uniref:Suppressor of fused domain protein n=1 Tax=Alteriqipengyuania halimionae TaxID=1926630 RepID=A0A6I4U4C4_9SPHN|nr:suppressor of fused domain protein [Alteriqipengyuania halimionae]MXP09302.1 suppressor of fused domain protein [Alteriqipengyuania halimionae]